MFVGSNFSVQVCAKATFFSIAEFFSMFGEASDALPPPDLVDPLPPEEEEDEEEHEAAAAA